MFRAAQTIYRELLAHDFPVSFEEVEDANYISLELPVKNGGNYYMMFICSEEDFVSVRTYGLAHLEPEQIPKLLPVLNRLNGEEVCIHFYCDEENGLIAAYDFPINVPFHPQSAFDIVVHFLTTIDEVYPKIMQALWA